MSRKNKGEITLLGVLLLAALVLAGVGVSYFSKEPDSPAEEAIESLLESQYNYDIDFSSDSKEGDPSQ